VSHSVATLKEETYGPLLGYPTFDGVSLNGEPADVFDSTLEWVQRSNTIGHPWVVSSDEVVPQTSDLWVTKNSLSCAR